VQVLFVRTKLNIIRFTIKASINKNNTVGPRYNIDVGVCKLSTMLKVDHEARPIVVMVAGGQK